MAPRVRGTYCHTGLWKSSVASLYATTFSHSAQCGYIANGGVHSPSLIMDVTVVDSDKLALLSQLRMLEVCLCLSNHSTSSASHKQRIRISVFQRWESTSDLVCRCWLQHISCNRHTLFLWLYRQSKEGGKQLIEGVHFHLVNQPLSQLTTIWIGKWTTLNWLYILSRYVPFVNFISMVLSESSH